MNTPDSGRALIDREVLESLRSAIGGEALGKLSDHFRELLPIDLAKIAAAAQAGDLILFRKQVHALAGAALSLGARGLAVRLRVLEVCQVLPSELELARLVEIGDETASLFHLMSKDIQTKY